MPKDLANFKQLLNSNFPIIIIETHDEKRVVDILRDAVSNTLSAGPLYIWSAINGLETDAGKTSSQWSIDGLETAAPKANSNTANPDEALKFIKDNIKTGVVLLPDFHAYLTNPSIVRMIKEIAQDFFVNKVTLVLVSHAFEVPPEIERLSAHLEINMPDAKKIRQLISEEVKIWRHKNQGKKIKGDLETINLLANNLLGLTESDVKRMIRGAIYDDDAITHCDVDEVMQAKYKMISKSGALSFEYDTASFADVGGFEKLKDWLEIRKNFFLKEDDNKKFDIPKGVLLVGVQGCGKSLAAKAIAGVWGVPLLKFDLGALFNKYIGESERNVRETLKSAELLSPCVLWIDEIEKGISSDNSDSGTSSRVLGTLLTWMAENKSRVFIVATSNDIEKLPPELMRKGRLDEIFFVDLPKPVARQRIFELHIKKRDHQLDNINLSELILATEGFSGAEIEQAVVAANYRAHAKEESLQTQHLLDEIQQTRPLSVVRKEAIDALRRWAMERTVSVD